MPRGLESPRSGTITTEFLSPTGAKRPTCSAVATSRVGPRFFLGNKIKSGYREATFLKDFAKNILHLSQIVLERARKVFRSVSVFVFCPVLLGRFYSSRPSFRMSCDLVSE